MKKVVEFTFQEASDLECILYMQIEQIEKDIKRYEEKINNTSKVYIKASYKDMIDKSKENKKLIENLLRKVKEAKITN